MDILKSKVLVLPHYEKYVLNLKNRAVIYLQMGISLQYALLNI